MSLCGPAANLDDADDSVSVALSAAFDESASFRVKAVSFRKEAPNRHELSLPTHFAMIHCIHCIKIEQSFLE
jgi:hypothetical protein